MVVVLENKNIDQVLGTGNAPYLDHLAQTGADFTNAHAETHPSQPNYLALFSRLAAWRHHQRVPNPSRGRQSRPANCSTRGLTLRRLRGVDSSREAAQATLSRACTRKSTIRGCRSTTCRVGGNQTFTAFPTDYARTADRRLRDTEHMQRHAQLLDPHRRRLAERMNIGGVTRPGPVSHNSLLVVTFDESESRHDSNGIVTLINGAGVRVGPVNEPIDHYRLLHTIEAMYRLPALGNAATTPPITDIWTS